MTKVLQTLQVRVYAKQNSWLFSGMTLGPTDSLQVTAANRVQIGWDNTYVGGAPNLLYAWPEGRYSPDSPTHAELPNDVEQYGGVNFPGSRWVVANTVPWSLAIALRPGTAPPLFGQGLVTDALRPNRSATFITPSSSQYQRVWLIFNDWDNAYYDNDGYFDVTLVRTTDEPLVIDLGQPSPTRYVPASIKAIKASEAQRLAYCLAIKPLYGPWEGYTSWDQPLLCPEYADALGNVVPALTLNPNIAAVSNMPLHLKLDTAAADLTALAPKVVDPDVEDLPYVFLDRDAVERRYYDGCWWEYFELDPQSDLADRLVWNAGIMGNAQLDDLIATIELSDLATLANNAVGDTYNWMCQVGQRFGEEFGTGRCRNAIMNDGPLRADWTVAATVHTVGWDTFDLAYGNVAQSGNALPAAFKDRLANGDLVFDAAPAGGPNFGYRANIKSGTSVSTGGTNIITVSLRLSLPFLPVVGNTALLTAGCRRTKTACIEYSNLKNMRGQDLTGNDDLLRRTRIG